MPSEEILTLSRDFLRSFLDELFRRQEVDVAALIELAHVPLDLVLAHRTGSVPTEP